MSAHRIRSARAVDLADLVMIYNHYVTTSHVTFDTEPFAVEARRAWFESFSESGPHRLLVAEVDSRLAGYATSKEFRAKTAYRTSVETTIYLDPDNTGRGIGHALYAALIALMEADPGVHRAYAGIALPNDGSIRLHERLGFKNIGTFHEVGWKFGKYWDVCWFEADVSGLKRRFVG